MNRIPGRVKIPPQRWPMPLKQPPSKTLTFLGTVRRRPSTVFIAGNARSSYCFAFTGTFAQTTAVNNGFYQRKFFHHQKLSPLGPRDGACTLLFNRLSGRADRPGV